MEYVISLLFEYENYWNHDEWQNRSTEYDHGLIWIPDVPPIDQDTEESCRIFAGYWGENITAQNPDPSRLPDARNPASLALADVANTADQFAAFLNCFQVHTCRPRYCLYVKHSSDKPPTCHF
jgi:hypothetical protein